jgi:hypothetical protein
MQEPEMLPVLRQGSVADAEEKQEQDDSQRQAE